MTVDHIIAFPLLAITAIGLVLFVAASTIAIFGEAEASQRYTALLASGAYGNGALVFHLAALAAMLAAFVHHGLYITAAVVGINMLGTLMGQVQFRAARNRALRLGLV